MLTVIVLFFIVASLLPEQARARSLTHKARPACKPFDLYAWAGPDSWTVGANDMLLVYTVFPCSHKAPKLKWKVDIGTVGNEPHHIAFNNDRSLLFAGGLFSFLSGLPSLYFFRTSSKEKPRLMHADIPINCTAADTAVALNDGGIIISVMGGPDGGVGGQLLIYDRNATFVSQFPPNAADLLNKSPYSGFNPHGITSSTGGEYILSADYLVPKSVLSPPLQGWDSIRVFNATSKRLLRTVRARTKAISGMGIMDIVWVNGLGIATWPAAGKLIWVDPASGKHGVAYDFHDNQASPQLSVQQKDGKHLFVSDYGRSKVVKFNSTNPKRLILQTETLLPEGAGPHSVVLSPDESMLIVSDYFLDAKNLGSMVQYPGDNKVHFIRVSDMKEIRDLLLDFNVIVNTTVAYRPHGIAVHPLP